MHRPVSVILLGRIDYIHALQIQQSMARAYLDYLHCPQHVQPKPRDTLLVCEHNPVYTVGIRDGNYDPCEERRLKHLGADFYRTRRGGLVTFHGPGQLVAYPIMNLAHYVKSVKWYISRLERTVISTCSELGLEASTSDQTGVWVNDKKIAAVGIQCRRYITMHGLSLNCNVDLKWYEHIVPCGIQDKGVTSLSRELEQNITLQAAIPVFLRAFAEEFNVRLIDLYRPVKGDVK